MARPGRPRGRADMTGEADCGKREQAGPSGPHPTPIPNPPHPTQPKPSKPKTINSFKVIRFQLYLLIYQTLPVSPLCL